MGNGLVDRRRLGSRARALPGTYFLFGTDADAFGDTGQWKYTLTCCRPPIISQTLPTTGSVTTTGSAAFADHLNTTGSVGKRRFVKTGGGTGLNVSFGGKITTTGTLAKGTYKATGTVADHFFHNGTWMYTLTVKDVTIAQSAPTTGTVPTMGSAAFTGHLNTTGNIGPVTFIKTGGGAGLNVSSGGQITTTGILASGTYTATGTMSDAFGDTGAWVYTLTIAGPPITQIAPITRTVTVAGSATFTDHLNTTGNIGAVTFTKTGGGAGLAVSSTGQITTTGTLAFGTYTATGTMSDAFRDTGAWVYTLTVASFPWTEPTSGSVTVAGSAAFTVQLRATGYTGPVTFAKTGGSPGLNVSSHGKITTTGTLAMGTYTATGTVADAVGDTGSFTYTLTVTAVTISQTAPTTGAVTTIGSAAFTDHLDTTGNIGKRRFVKTGGGTGLKVSFGGKITTTGTLAKGTYKATGTVADHFGDTGTFTYTLTVKAVSITQTTPASGSVTIIGSPAFTDQFNTTGSIGAVTFAGGGAGLTVSSTGQITTTGTLAMGTHTATGTMSDAYGDTGTFTYTLTIAGSPPPQTAPTSGSVTVSGSVAFTVQLRTTGNLGPVTFTQTGGGTGLRVSFGGKITTTGTLAKGIHTATGTTSDAFGNTGTWVSTLTVKAAAITQTGSHGRQLRSGLTGTLFRIMSRSILQANIANPVDYAPAT